MSLKSMFLVLEKVDEVVQIRGRGGGNLDKSKRRATFFCETFPEQKQQVFQFDQGLAFGSVVLGLVVLVDQQG